MDKLSLMRCNMRCLHPLYLSSTNVNDLPHSNPLQPHRLPLLLIRRAPFCKRIICCCRPVPLQPLPFLRILALLSRGLIALVGGWAEDALQGGRYPADGLKDHDIDEGEHGWETGADNADG